MVASSAPSAGHCNTMGTALSMTSMAEALGMSLPGCAAIPAPYRERGQIAYETGRRAVEIVHEDLRPSKILTRAAFENAIVAASALGASTNCPPHVNAIARHIGVDLDVKDWDKIGYERSEEHTSELQSLMRISYAVFCLKKKKKQHLYQYK